ncbi:hypothetical protein A3K82_02330 [Candidatus Pacearchaeota archaeon RBG_19FT_COMBO_34_9]|nr:MAG: hypothetical protein A3K82_02330 [Candidatus Pacearchaeota archaeon RBG_19FT_COMBO_34_9]OGJ16118.1 MAG: hypothetical protein A3K74_02710 [Candidatus Pacearchaeota archaeon RBG_13_33_26]
MKKSRIIRFIKKNNLTIFPLLIIIFSLLWNLDRYFPICSYRIISLIIAIILEVIILFKKL